MERLTIETVNTFELPEGIEEVRGTLNIAFEQMRAGRTADDWIIANVNSADEVGILTGLTDREKYIYGLATLSAVLGGMR